MTEFFITISDPELRRFAETALDFIKSVYRDEVLARLEYVFVTSAYSKSDADEMLRVAGKVLPSRSLAYSTVAGLAEDYEGGGGRYYYLTPRLLAVSLLRGVDGFATLAHEFAHHALQDHLDDLIKILREDVPELDQIVAVALETNDEEVVRMAERVGDAAAYFATEYSAEYAAANYFVLLNTEPVLRSQEVEDVEVFREFGDISLGTVVTLKNFEVFVTERKLPEALSGRLAELARATIKKMVHRPDLPKYKSALHSILRSKVSRWPKEVYLSDPRRFDSLFEGLEKDLLRRHGIPMMV
jgi:hypothetical protein